MTPEQTRAIAAAQAAHAAGFAGRDLTTIVAIAGAESGWNPNARCHDCFPGIREDSRGLWQINVDAHPQWAGLNLYDPATNAQCAYSLYRGRHGGFGDWSTYTSGAYLTKWPVAAAAVHYVTGAAPAEPYPGGPGTGEGASGKPGANGEGLGAKIGGVIGDTGHAIKSTATAVPDFLGILANPHTWVRVLEVIGGLGAIVVGAYLIDSDLVTGAAKTVGGYGAAGIVGSKAATAAEVAAVA